MTLVRRGAPFYQGNGCFRRHTVVLQLMTNQLGIGQPHVKHRGVVGYRQRSPVQLQVTVALAMAGDKGDALGVVTVGERKTGILAPAAGEVVARPTRKAEPVLDRGFPSLPPPPKIDGT